MVRDFQVSQSTVDYNSQQITDATSEVSTTAPTITTGIISSEEVDHVDVDFEVIPDVNTIEAKPTVAIKEIGIYTLHVFSFYKHKVKPQNWAKPIKNNQITIK